MAITFIGGAFAASGGTFTLPADTQEDDVIVLNYGSAHQASGVTFSTPSGYTKLTESTVIDLAQAMFVGVAGPSPTAPSITCSAGSEYNCTLAVFRGVNTSDPAPRYEGPTFDSGVSLDIPSPGLAITNGVAVGCVFVEDDGDLSNPSAGSIAVEHGEVDGPNSLSGIVYWPSPDGRQWTVGSVRWGEFGVPVGGISVNQDQTDPAVCSSLLLRPA